MSINKIGKALAAAVLLGLASASAAFAETVDLNLDKAVYLALVNNVDVKISQADLDIADAQKSVAKRARWGSISYNHTFGRGGYYDYDPISHIGQRLASSFKNAVSLQVPIFNLAMEGNIKKSAFSYKSAVYGLENSLEQVKLDATNGFYGVLQAANSVALTKESVERLESHLRNVKAQFEVGTVAKADVLRSEVELANAQQEMTKALNAHDLAIANLNNVIGLPHDTDLNITDELGYKEYKPTLEDCLTFAMANRPAIHQARLAVEGAKADRLSAIAGYTPSFNASASNSWSHDAWPGVENRQWSVGISMNMNIFDGGVTAAKISAAKAGIVKAQESYRKAENDVRLDVRSNYNSMREAESRIRTSAIAVSQADEDYKIAVLRYEAGVGTNTDVMDAHNALTKAKNNYVQALYDYNTFGAKLDKSMGVPVIEQGVPAVETVRKVTQYSKVKGSIKDQPVADKDAPLPEKLSERAIARAKAKAAAEKK